MPRRFTAFLCLITLTGCGGGGTTAPRMVEPPPEPAEVRIVDGDTVDVDGVRYRLHGIDAPESYQTCRAWGLTWRCGDAATAALESRVAGMTCSGSGTDRYGRTIGVCSAGGEDLNAWMVANGWALAEYAADYNAQEAQAREARRGIHRGEFVTPAERRRGTRLEGEDTFSYASTDGASVDVEQLATDLLWNQPMNFDGVLLEHSAFGLTDGAAVSFGDFRDMLPTSIGRVEWRGQAIAVDALGHVSRGTSMVDIDDLAAPDVDVVLSGLSQDLSWTDVRLDLGLFDAEDGSMWGGFFGPEQEEVGGVFERAGLTGAFGGSR